MFAVSCRFMSLMCHEVRTPLNGCLASAEMLLETPLKVRVATCVELLQILGNPLGACMPDAVWRVDLGTTGAIALCLLMPSMAMEILHYASCMLATWC
jgi:signal transduction histidine kinase